MCGIMFTLMHVRSTTILVYTSELYHKSGVRTLVQRVKPKVAEIEEPLDVNLSPLRGLKALTRQLL